MRLLQVEQIAVDDIQQISAVESLLGLELTRIDGVQLVALIVQPGDFALDAVGAYIRKLAVVFMLALLRGEGGLRGKVALYKAVGGLLPLLARLRRRPLRRCLRLWGWLQPAKHIKTAAAPARPTLFDKDIVFPPSH